MTYVLYPDTQTHPTTSLKVFRANNEFKNVQQVLKRRHIQDKLPLFFFFFKKNLILKYLYIYNTTPSYNL